MSTLKSFQHYNFATIRKSAVLQNYNVENFSIVDVWNNLIKKNKLFGFESFNNFYHLTDLKTFKKLKDL